MLETLTLVLAIPIAKAVLEKFYESFGDKLGEKAAELIPAKVKQLGELVWEKCLRGKSGGDQLLEQAANGSVDAQTKLTQYLHNVLDKDPSLRQASQKIAEEIHLEVNNDFGQMNQTNRDQSTGYQTKTGPNNTNFFGGTHHH